MRANLVPLIKSLEPSLDTAYSLMTCYGKLDTLDTHIFNYIDFVLETIHPDPGDYKTIIKYIKLSLLFPNLDNEPEWTEEQLERLRHIRPAEEN